MNCTYHVISHTHWDREWYLTHQQFRLRLVQLMDNLLDLLASDPRFRFFHLDGQTIVLRDYLEIRPWRRQEIAARVREGRLLIGPWYLQNDEFLTSPESTVRNLLLGRALAREFGEEMRVGYLPDQFGHIDQMPQILRGFGIESAVFGRGYNSGVKGDGGAPARRPAEFLWEAPDGSRVLAINMPTWYNNAQRFPAEPGQALALLRKIVRDLEPYNTTGEFLLMNGVDHLEAQENLSAVLEGLQGSLRRDERIIHSALPAFVRAVQERLIDPPVHRGELRRGSDDEVIPGVASSRLYLKQANNRLENLVEKGLEPLAAWCRLAGSDLDLRDHLRWIWTNLMQNHPHDSISGCSVDAVHREMMARFAAVEEVAADLLDRAGMVLAARVDRAGLAPERDQLLLVANTGHHPRTALIETAVDLPAGDGLSGFVLEDPEGRPVPYIRLGVEKLARTIVDPVNLPKEFKVERHHLAFLATDLPAMGYAAYAVRPGEPPPVGGGGDGAASGPLNILENAWLRAEIHPDGTFDLLHKPMGRLYAGLHRFEDTADAGDAYNYRPLEGDAPVWSDGLAAGLVREDGGALYQRAVLTWDWPLPAGLTADGRERRAERAVLHMRSTLTLARDLPYLAVETAIRNDLCDHRLRVVFPTGLPADHFYTGGHFGLVRREFGYPASVGRRTNTEPNRNFACVEHGGEGFAVLNRALPEVELLPGGGLALTLLRAVGTIFPVDREYPQVQTLAPEAQCRGEWIARYALYPYGGDLHRAEVFARAEEFNAPPPAIHYPLDGRRWRTGRPWLEEPGIDGTAVRPDPEGHLPRLPRRYSFLSLTGGSLAVSALKPAESGDGIILRYFNHGPEPVAPSLRFGAPLRRAYLTNLAETRESPLPVGEGGEIAPPPAGPGKIVTVEVVPGRETGARQ